MIFINNNCTNPYLNHSIEEYIFKYTDYECFILWRNTKSILIGKNQNLLKEINIDYAKEKNIDIVRRVSGGGTVFCDLGNLNFSFIAHKKSMYSDFKVFTKPIIKALKVLGIESEFTGRNDLIVDGKKICGNAQYSSKDKVLHHGTLLFDSDLSELISALKSNPIKFKDKSVKSVKNCVTNLRKYLRSDMNVETFKDTLINLVMKQFNCNEFYTLNEAEWKIINEISKQKFESWEWNYGKSPKFNFFNQDKFKCGVVQINLLIKNGIIKGIKINGDFFGNEDICGLEKIFKNAKYEENYIRNILNKIDISIYINNLSVDEFISVIFGYN